MTADVMRRPDWFERPTPNEGDEWLDARVTMRRTDIETRVGPLGEWIAVYGCGGRASRRARKHRLGSQLADRLREQSRFSAIGPSGRLDTWGGIASVWKREGNR